MEAGRVSQKRCFPKAMLLENSQVNLQHGRCKLTKRRETEPAKCVDKIFSESLTLSYSSGILKRHYASVAQSAEHNHGKVGVSGSIPLGSFLFL